MISPTRRRQLYLKRYQRRYQRAHVGEYRLNQRMPWPDPEPSSPLTDSLIILKRAVWPYVEVTKRSQPA
jgi:hypothetical protein